MTIIPIRKHNDPVLREVAQARFDWKDEGHMRAAKDLQDTFMDSPRARGIAATQLGIMLRLFIMKTQERGIFLVANPIVVSATAELEVQEEECLSFPNLRVKVIRPERGIVSFETLIEGSPLNVETPLSGWDFRCYLHELDHLNGITLDMIRRARRA